MTSTLDALKKLSIVVADTADFGLLAEYQAQDATTNPSLILAGTKIEKYNGLIEDAIKWGKTQGSTKEEQLENTIDKLTVSFGLEILKVVPGRVSTEVDDGPLLALLDRRLQVRQLDLRSGGRGEKAYSEHGGAEQRVQAGRGNGLHDHVGG